MRWALWLVLSVCGLLLAGCATPGEPLPSRDSTLFDRLGGKARLTAIVADFVVRVTANESRLQRFFTQVDQAALQNTLLHQLCEASGGPCRYAGKNMRSAHQGLRVSATDFDTMLEYFGVTLDKFKVSENDKRAWVAFLGAFRQDIVQR